MCLVLAALLRRRGLLILVGILDAIALVAQQLIGGHDTVNGNVSVGAGLVHAVVVAPQATGEAAEDRVGRVGQFPHVLVALGAVCACMYVVWCERSVVVSVVLWGWNGTENVNPCESCTLYSPVQVVLAAAAAHASVVLVEGGLVVVVPLAEVAVRVICKHILVCSV